MSGERKHWTALSKTKWVDASTVAVCMCCKALAFGFLSRRHHCRLCGHVVCDECSCRKHPLAAELRQCADCYKTLSAQTAGVQLLACYFGDLSDAAAEQMLMSPTSTAQGNPGSWLVHGCIVPFVSITDLLHYFQRHNLPPWHSVLRQPLTPLGLRDSDRHPHGVSTELVFCPKCQKPDANADGPFCPACGFDTRAVLYEELGSAAKFSVVRNETKPVNVIRESPQVQPDVPGLSTTVRSRLWFTPKDSAVYETPSLFHT